MCFYFSVKCSQCAPKHKGTLGKAEALSNQDQIQTWIKLSDVYIETSWNENCKIVVLEFVRLCTTGVYVVMLLTIRLRKDNSMNCDLHHQIMILYCSK